MVSANKLAKRKVRLRLLVISTYFYIIRKGREGLKPSGIGGQAVLEGIMMKNKDQYSVAVRKPDGKIEVHTSVHESIAGHRVWAKLPLIRGVVNFIDSLILGMETLTFSASSYE